MRILSILFIVIGVAGACEPWQIGQLFLQGSADSGNPENYESVPFYVSHPDLAQDCDGWLAVGAQCESIAVPVGVLALFSGSQGTDYITDHNPETHAMFETLRDSGWLVIQVSWKKSWWQAYVAGAEDAGIAHLAARPATVIDYIYGAYCAADSLPLVCAGQSGGSAQVAYALSHYGLESKIARLVASGGPPFCALDKSCMDTPGEENFWLNDGKLSQVDKAHGIATNGPAINHDPTWIPRWKEESIAISGNDYSHPTQIRFILGDMDTTMQTIAAEWHNRLVLNPTNDVTWQIIENTAHKVYDTEQGRQAILSAIVAP